MLIVPLLSRDVVPMPKLTDEGYRVTLFRIREGYPESSADILSAVRAVLLVSDARMHDEKLIAGDVFVWEVSLIFIVEKPSISLSSFDIFLIVES